MLMTIPAPVPPALVTAAVFGSGAFLDGLRDFAVRNWDTLTALILVPVMLIAIGRRLRARTERQLMSKLQRQFWMLGLSSVGLLWVILTLEAADQADLLKLLGILLSAAIAFSSTTLIGNALAGFMLRAQRHFRLGDYLQVEEHFGSVSERSLFFTEIQNEMADLVTLPNSYLTSRPVTVWQQPSTLINTEVSLGYDVPRTKVKRLLLAAAEAAELENPFVYILSLGDFSVSYRITGKLKDTKELLTARSRLRGRVLDALHEGGVEIVSPTFMNQRLLAGEEVFIPSRHLAREEPEKAPEAEMFAKAVKAASVERLKEMVSELEEKIRETKAALGEVKVAEERPALEARLANRQQRQERLLEAIKQRESAES
jgi:small-conductance mechanosensitive channel